MFGRLILIFLLNLKMFQRQAPRQAHLEAHGEHSRQETKHQTDYIVGRYDNTTQICFFFSIFTFSSFFLKNAGAKNYQHIMKVGIKIRINQKKRWN